MVSQQRAAFILVPEDAVQNIRKIYELDKPGRMEEAVSILEKWIQKQDHIIKKDFSKIYLEKTLISTKGSVEKVKKQIDGLCTMRTLLPKFFTTCNIKLEMQDFLDTYEITILPKLTTDYYRVVIAKVKSGNQTSEMYLKYYQFCVLLGEYFKKYDYSNGFILINDIRELNIFDAMTAINMMELQQFASILMEGYGARIKSINLVSESKAIELFIKTIKQFVSEKLGNRMHVHPDVKELSKFVDKDILPEEYGGKERCSQELYKELVEDISSVEFIQHMKMMNKACTDESRRNAAKFNEEYLGMPGSFRNLSVD